MDNLDHPALIEEYRQNIDSAAYENNLKQDLKIPPINKKMTVMINMNNGKQVKRKVSAGYLFLISWILLQTG